MLSLILPTFNEAASIVHLLEAIDTVLCDTSHEIIIVDDNSPDGTWKIALDFAERRPWIRVLRRIGKRGLSSAVYDGFMAANGDILAVMDADGQHDVALLISMLHSMQQGTDVTIGSRYVSGGSVGDWVTDRRIISSLGTRLANRLSVVEVSDPLSGFFLLRRDLFQRIRHKLHPSGFKILFEILAAIPADTHVQEVPLIFRMRTHGTSKLSASVHLQFLFQVVRLGCRRFSPTFPPFGTCLFLALLCLTFLLIFPTFWRIREIYFDTALRQHVQKSLVLVVEKQGWLLSDVQLTSVSQQSIDITHRDHVRIGTRDRYCQIFLGTSILSCDDSLFQ